MVILAFISDPPVVRKILSLQGVHNYTPADLRAGLEFLAANHEQFPFERLIAETFPLEEADTAFASASETGALRVAVRAEHAL